MNSREKQRYFLKFWIMRKIWKKEDEILEKRLEVHIFFQNKSSPPCRWTRPGYPINFDSSLIRGNEGPVKIFRVTRPGFGKKFARKKFSPPYFFWKVFALFFRKSLRPPSMNPAWVPHKFWPVPSHLALPNNLVMSVLTLSPMGRGGICPIAYVRNLKVGHGTWNFSPEHGNAVIFSEG